MAGPLDNFDLSRERSMSGKNIIVVGEMVHDRWEVLVRRRAGFLRRSPDARRVADPDCGGAARFETIRTACESGGPIRVLEEISMRCADYGASCFAYGIRRSTPAMASFHSEIRRSFYVDRDCNVRSEVCSVPFCSIDHAVGHQLPSASGSLMFDAYVVDEKDKVRRTLLGPGCESPDGCVLIQSRRVPVHCPHEYSLHLTPKSLNWRKGTVAVVSSAGRSPSDENIQAAFLEGCLYEPDNVVVVASMDYAIERNTWTKQKKMVSCIRSLEGAVCAMRQSRSDQTKPSMAILVWTDGPGGIVTARRAVDPDDDQVSSCVTDVQPIKDEWSRLSMESMSLEEIAWLRASASMAGTGSGDIFSGFLCLSLVAEGSSMVCDVFSAVEESAARTRQAIIKRRESSFIGFAEKFR